MRSSSSKQKKVATPSKRDSGSQKGSQKTSASSLSVAKSSVKLSSVKTSSSFSKKIKRHTKQGIKSLLLSTTFYSTCKVMSVAVVSFGLLYASYFFISKSFANEVIVSQSEIVARVAKHTALPNENPYEVVRVQDEEDLRKQNPFYKDVKEGNYIIVFKDLVIIYDLRNDAIIGIRRSGGR